MQTTYLGGDEDMAWLRSTHWPTLPDDARYAVLYGNTDAPQRVEVWAYDQPTHDQPADYTMTHINCVEQWDAQT